MIDDEFPLITPHHGLAISETDSIERLTYDSWERLQGVSEEVIIENEPFSAVTFLHSQMLYDKRIFFRDRLAEHPIMEFDDPLAKYRST